jgi:hypothetical protein
VERGWKAGGDPARRRRAGLLRPVRGRRVAKGREGRRRAEKDMQAVAIRPLGVIGVIGVIEVIGVIGQREGGRLRAFRD